MQARIKSAVDEHAADGRTLSELILPGGTS